MTFAPRIDVCICTFRRPQVCDTIASVLAQSSGAPAFRIIIADNDDTPSAAESVASFRDTAIEVVHIHAPARNISIARNACLDAATGEYVAFLDDDQIASPEWLSALFQAASESGADVVLGPVVAVCPPDAPSWARDGGFHSTFPVIRSKTGIETGYTGNVLIKRATIGANRFDPELGRSGGEDTVFFHQLKKAGARIAYAPGAMMREYISPARMSLSWLMRRSFRSGQTHARLIARQGERPARVILMSSMKFIACLAMAAGGVFSETAWRRALVRGMLHAGIISACLGHREAEAYGHAAT